MGEQRGRAHFRLHDERSWMWSSELKGMSAEGLGEPWRSEPISSGGDDGKHQIEKTTTRCISAATREGLYSTDRVPTCLGIQGSLGCKRSFRNGNSEQTQQSGKSKQFIAKTVKG